MEKDYVVLCSSEWMRSPYKSLKTRIQEEARTASFKMKWECQMGVSIEYR